MFEEVGRLVKVCIQYGKLVMKEKTLIFCQSWHQLEKGLYLCEMLDSNVQVASLFCSKKQLKNKIRPKFIDKINFYDLKKGNKEFLKEYKKFIFFSTVPSKQLYELISIIRNQNSRIISIQETHQLGMHNGLVNSIVFSPDNILVASDLEKKLYSEFDLLPLDSVFSEGWLFQKNFIDFTLQLYEVQKINLNKKYILIFFSAPNSITTLSPETDSVRRKILNFARSRFPNFEIKVKLHPLEDIQLFKYFLNNNGFGQIKIVDSSFKILQSSKMPETLIISDKTQAFIDSIHLNVPMMIYQLGKKNFITNYLQKSQKIIFDDELKIYDVRSPKDELKDFQRVFLKNEANALVRLSILLERCTKLNTELAQSEIGCWNYIYKVPDSTPLKRLVKKNSSNLKTLEAVLSNKDQFSIDDLCSFATTLSLKTALGIILVQKIIAHEIIDQRLIKSFVANFYTDHFIQYFSISALRLNYYLKNINQDHLIDKNKLALLKSAKNSLSEKSKPLKILFYLIDNNYSNNVETAKILFFKIFDLILFSIEKLKS